MAANQFAQDVRRVQEWAMSAREFDDTFQRGYGIYINVGGSYSLYTDGNGDGYYTSGGTDIIRETIALNQNIEISSIVPNPPISINFAPPNPTTKISNGSDSDVATIIFRIKANPSITRSVIINRAGLVYVQ
jgi:hypothetical protein